MVADPTSAPRIRDCAQSREHLLRAGHFLKLEAGELVNEGVDR